MATCFHRHSFLPQLLRASWGEVMKAVTSHMPMKIVSYATSTITGQYLPITSSSTNAHLYLPEEEKLGVLPVSGLIQIYLPPSDYQAYGCHFWQHPNTSTLLGTSHISPGSKGSMDVNQKDVTEESRSKNPYLGGCGDNSSWVRNDANTQCHCPCFNQSVNFLPARQQVVISYVDK